MIQNKTMFLLLILLKQFLSKLTTLICGCRQPLELCVSLSFICTCNSANCDTDGRVPCIFVALIFSYF